MQDTKTSPGARGVSVDSALYGSQLALQSLGEYDLAAMVESLRSAISREPRSIYLRVDIAADTQLADQSKWELQEWAQFLLSIVSLLTRQAMADNNLVVFRELQYLRANILERVVT